MPQEQIGRIAKVDRPGFISWDVADIQARDGLTALDDGATAITADDIGRVCRVGTQAPYDYYELVGVGPLAWAHINPDTDIPARRAQLAFYTGDAGETGGVVIGQYVVPPMEGGIVIPQGPDAVNMFSDVEPTGSGGIDIEKNGFYMGYSAVPVYENSTVDRQIELLPGDVLALRLYDDGLDPGVFGPLSVSLFGRYAPDLVGVPSGPPQGVNVDGGVLVFHPFRPADGSGVKEMGVYPQDYGNNATSGNVKLAVYEAVDDGNGGFQPGDMIQTETLQFDGFTGEARTTFDTPIAVTEGQLYFAAFICDSGSAQFVKGAYNTPFAEQVAYSTSPLPTYTPANQDNTAPWVIIDVLTDDEYQRGTRGVEPLGGGGGL